MLGKVKEKVDLEDIGIDGRILLEWTLKMWNGRTWTNLILLGQRQVLGCCVYGNGTSCFIKCGGFPEQPRNCWSQGSGQPFARAALPEAYIDC
jgi:hypothetical protein